jgi:hypothetical protein
MRSLVAKSFIPSSTSNKLLQDHAKKTRRYENLNRKKRGKSELCERREHKKWLTIM